ncbi:MAG: hypothetical protein K2L10_11235 [Ruminococcus sp.]|nr:hypothetical protein [Ruminococcus sp.]
MYSLITDYKKSCCLVKERIKVLTQQRNQLIKSGNRQIAEDLNLEQRIRLLYVEYAQMREIIEHLTNYTRRVEERGKT